MGIMFLNLASFLGMRWKQDLRGSGGSPQGDRI